MNKTFFLNNNFEKAYSPGKKNYIGINVRKDVLRPFKEKTVTYKKGH